MKTKFLEIDRPTINGRVYPKEVVEKALKLFLERTGREIIPIVSEPKMIPKLDDIVGFARDVKIEEGYLCGEVEFIDGKIQSIVSEGEGICIRPNGVGSIRNGVVQDDYRLNGFSIVRKKEIV